MEKEEYKKYVEEQRQDSACSIKKKILNLLLYF